MARLAKKPDAGFAQRLKVAIRETGLTQEEFAASIGTTGHNVSRWVTRQQAPDAPGMAKLAKGLKGRFIWVLTGEDSAALDQQIVALVQSLSVEDQRVVSILAKILADPDRSRYARWIVPMIGHIEGVELTMQQGRRVRTTHPDSGLTASPGNESLSR